MSGHLAIRSLLVASSALCAAVFLAPLVVAHSDACASIESAVEADVQRVSMAKDEVGVFRTIGDRALDGVRQCPQSARLWYLASRSAEVLETRLSGQAFVAQGGLTKIVSDALTHASSSAAVVTVAARVRRSAALARQALALDSSYEPARRALAELLAKEGDVDEALRLAAAGRGRGPMHLTRARVLLAANRPAEAIQEAKKIMPGQPDELAPAGDLYRDAQEILGFALLDLHKPAEARKALQAAAAAGSVAAQKQLAGSRF